MLVQKLVIQNTSNCKSVINVNTSRSCKYGHVFLMIGENIA